MILADKFAAAPWRRLTEHYGVRLLGSEADWKTDDTLVTLENAWARIVVSINRNRHLDEYVYLLQVEKRIGDACAAMRRKAEFDGYSAGDAYEESLQLVGIDLPPEIPDAWPNEWLTPMAAT